MTFHKLGEKFWWHPDPDTNVCLRVVADGSEMGCLDCYFRNHDPEDSAYKNDLEECSASHRPDNIDIHFEEDE